MGAMLLCLVLILVLKELRVRHSVIFSAAACIFFLLISLQELAEVFSWMRAFSEKSGFAAYFGVLLKSLGIALCTGFLAEFCRDLGEGALSRVTELCGKAAILSLAFPLLRDFLDLVLEAITQNK